MLDFLRLLKRLSTHKLEYVLVDGLAASAHGSSMVTQDVDILMPFDAKNQCLLFQAISDFDPRHRMDGRSQPFTEQDASAVHFQNLNLETKLGQLDCLSEIKGLGDYQQVISDIQQVDMQEFILPLLSIPALIQAKLAMGRPRDLETVSILRALNSQQL